MQAEGLSLFGLGLLVNVTFQFQGVNSDTRKDSLVVLLFSSIVSNNPGHLRFFFNDNYVWSVCFRSGVQGFHYMSVRTPNGKHGVLHSEKSATVFFPKLRNSNRFSVYCRVIVARGMLLSTKERKNRARR